MAIPNRERRTIVVDEVEYHWTRGKNDGWATVQHGSGRGPLLRIDLCDVPLPADIADTVRFAASCGWTPTKGRKTFYLGFATRPGMDRFVLRAADSPPYVRSLQELRSPAPKAEP